MMWNSKRTNKELSYKNSVSYDWVIEKYKVQDIADNS